MSDTKPLLLSYKVTTHPSPLQSGTIGEVTITFHAGKNDILCENLNFIFEYGNTPGNVFVDAPTLTNILPVDSGWKPSDNSPIDELNTRIFVINNDNLGEKVQGAVSLTFKGTVNASQVPGVIHLKELSAESTGGIPHLELKSADLSVPVPAPPNFQINSFIANDADTEGHVVTEFTNGKGFDLLWSAQGAESYQVFQANKPEAIYTGSETKHHIASGISRATTFTLEATSADKKTLYKSLTIFVSNPDLTPRTSQITNKPDSGDTFTVVGDKISMSGSNFELDAPTRLKGKVSIDGDHSSGERLEVNTYTYLNDFVKAYRMQVNTDLTVFSNFVCQANNYLGSVDVLNTLKVARTITAGGDLKVHGPVSIFGNMQMLYDSGEYPPNGPWNYDQCPQNISETYTAPTDGLLIALLENLPDENNGTSSDAYVTVAGLEFRMSAMFNNYTETGYLTLPVKNGEEFSLKAELYWTKVDGNATPQSKAKLYWRPLGLDQNTLPDKAE